MEHGFARISTDNFYYFDKIYKICRIYQIYIATKTPRREGILGTNELRAVKPQPKKE